ncbi:hypothetical protein [Treponema zioleckii]|uniref:hypothetical protein n=1 Tax=Treponema zioleckii TaxID=331680 RepID=UPI00168A7EBE|nr:hypothetical protein [Treponema zioleckii]
MKLSKVILFVSGFTSLAFFSCKKEPEKIETVEIEQTSSDHKWFAFANNSFTETSLPQNAPVQPFRPWTESVRISDGNGGTDGRGYFVVNHLGILVFDGGEVPVLIQDYQLFSTATSSNLVFDKGGAYFTLSRNSFFNKFNKTAVYSVSENPVEAEKQAFEEAGSIGSNRPYLVRISPENKMLYPVVTYGDLNLEDDTEVSGMYFNGSEWLASLKKSTENRTSFKYIQWRPNGNLAGMPAQTKNGKIFIEESTEGIYRKANMHEPFSSAPNRLKNLLSSIPDSFAFFVVCHVAGGESPHIFVNGNANSPTLTQGCAIMTEAWIASVFSDGTTYFCGALENRPLINNGKTIAMRLPKLPENYYYGDFVISGDYLVVSWEESSFYKTGRSGFLVVDMGELFYPKSVDVESLKQ